LRKIREILRLKEEAGLTNRASPEHARSNSTVGEYLQRAQAAGLHWPLPEGLSEDELYQKLFRKAVMRDPDRPLRIGNGPRELKKKGVTLKLWMSIGSALRWV